MMEGSIKSCMVLLPILLFMALMMCPGIVSTTSAQHHRHRHHHHHHKYHHHHHHHHGSDEESYQKDQPASSNHQHQYDDDDLPVLPEPGSYIPSNCSDCDLRREELRQRNLQLIKDQILSKLGMKTAPNMTGRLPPRIPPLERLMDLYGMQGDSPDGWTTSSVIHQHQPFRPGPVYDEEEDDFHARTERIIAFAQPLGQVRSALKSTASNHGMESMYFKFSDKVTQTSNVTKAHLWLYLNGLPTTPSNHGKTNASVCITVFQVVSIANGESPVLKRVRETKVALENKGAWVSIRLEGVVADWFRRPDKNKGLVVQAELTDNHSSGVENKNHNIKLFHSVDSTSSDGSSNAPFMEVVTTDGRKVRTKRTIGLNCDESSAETRCCRYPLTVDFVDFGWDWIIAPKKYEANYCAGECPYVFLQQYPHTHIVQQANHNRAQGPSGSAGPCCAPRKMSSITMLYFDNEFNIVYGKLPGMVVDRCGCS